MHVALFGKFGKFERWSTSLWPDREHEAGDSFWDGGPEQEGSLSISKDSVREVCEQVC